MSFLPYYTGSSIDSMNQLNFMNFSLEFIWLSDILPAVVPPSMPIDETLIDPALTAVLITEQQQKAPLSSWLMDEKDLILMQICLQKQSAYGVSKKRTEFWQAVSQQFVQKADQPYNSTKHCVETLVEKRKLYLVSLDTGDEDSETNLTKALDAWILMMKADKAKKQAKKVTAEEQTAQERQEERAWDNLMLWMSKKQPLKSSSEDFSTDNSDNGDLPRFHSPFVAHSCVHSPSVALSDVHTSSVVTSSVVFFCSHFITSVTFLVKQRQWQQQSTVKRSRRQNNSFNTKSSTVQALIIMFQMYIQQEGSSKNTDAQTTETKTRASEAEARVLKTRLRIEEAEQEKTVEKKVFSRIDRLKTQLNTQTNQILAMLNELRKNLT